MQYKCVHQYVEEIAAAMPGKIAVEDSAGSITYGALNNRASGIAQLLMSLLQEKEPVIATLLPGSIDLVSSVLGIFKCGGIYLPLDKGFTPLRMQQVFKQSAPSILITRRELPLPPEAKAPYIMILESNGSITVLDASYNELMRISETENPGRAVEVESGCYIIYTSGSTGMGKAILGCHKGLSHFIHWELQEFGIGSECRVSQLSQVTFDASLRDLFVPLCSGGTLYIPDAEIKNNAGKLLKWLEEKEITLVHCVPSIFRLLTRELEPSKDHLPKLRYILMAGECLYGRDIQNWRRSAGAHVELVNLYGTSETTMAKTFHRIKEIPENEAQVIHVGKPISNAVVAITNGNHICKVGEIGEIYIKTPFWSKGYYKDPALTAEVFVQNPLVTDRVDIVYKTGDMGRYLPGREIEVLGRTDDQVKVNGIRVTLGEVEQAVLKVPGIAEVAVVAHRNGTNDTELICYYRGEITDTDKLRTALKPVLNNQLMPSWFVRMESFPLNLNGKTDKKSLPKPEELLLEELEYEEVIDETERRLEKIWQEVLGRERIGRKVSFFKVGGTSLKAIQVISRIFRELDVSLILAHLFSHPTIAALAKCVQKASVAEYELINPIPQNTRYAVSHQQKRLWIIDQLEGDEGTAYTLSGSYVLEGKLNREALAAAVLYVVSRHESLRTVFEEESGELYQRILDMPGYELEYRDLRGVEDGEEQARQESHHELSRGFDLQQGPLIRTSLLQLQEEKYVFILSMHHIISDGWSMEVLMGELLHCYEVVARGELPSLPPLRIQYKDYAAWQNGLLLEEHTSGHRAYWHEQLKGELPVLQLPYDGTRVSGPRSKSGKLALELNGELSNQVREAAQSAGASVFMVLLSAVKILLHRYSGQHDIIVGIPVAGRDHVELENQVGFYVNTLAIRSQVQAEIPAGKFLQQIKEQVLNGYAHQVYPFDKLVEELGGSRDPGRMPIFDVMVAMQATVGIGDSGAGLGEVSVKGYESGAGLSKYDLVFYFRDWGGEILLEVEYNTALFGANRMERMAGHFRCLLEGMVKDMGVSLGALNYMPQQEYAQMRALGESESIQASKTGLVALFQEQVLLRGEQTALIDKNGQLSYKELNARSNQLAWWLREQYNIQPNEVVGIMMDGSEWMIIAIWGILKSGAGYVPVDPSYPAERQQYMLQKAHVRCVLTEGMVPEILSEAMRSNNLPLLSGGHHTAYIMYTSGSTGLPKGVVVEQRSVVNLVKDTNYVNFQPHHRVLQASSYAFDGSVFGIFGALLNGSTLCLVDRETLLSAELLAGYIREHGVNLMFMPTALFNSFVELNADCISGFDNIYIGGEALSVPHIRSALAYRKYPGSLVNGYGPTETTVFAAYHVIEELEESARTVPLGRPLKHVQLYVLDDRMKPQAMGVEGEICIGGAGLARGYLQAEEAGQERFVQNPFEPGSRLYRTGDRGRWREDGTLEYMGRKDGQVKLRGHRIELGEIETVMNSCAEIKQSLVLAFENAGGKYLTGYYRCGAKLISEADLRRFLAQKLPAYMIPSRLIFMETFPLTSNGKIDRDRLPRPEEQATNASYQSATNETEAILISVWEQVLGRSPIGIHDNFFELGGDSIKAIQVSAKLFKRGLQLKIRDLFSNPDIEKLAAYIQIAQPKPADQSAVTGELPLTPVQQQFFHTQNELHHFNQSVLLFSKEGFDIDGVRRVMNKLMEHHDALRMTFTIDGKAINKGTEQTLLVSLYEPTDEEELAQLVNQLQADMRIDQGPLVQSAVFHMNDGDRWFIAIHHLVIDGVSWRILFEDIGTLYSQYVAGSELTLPPKTNSFKAWSQGLCEYANSKLFLKEASYWKKLEETPVRALTERKADVLVKDSIAETFVLSPEETEKLRTVVHQAYGTDINDILLAGLSRSIREIFGHRHVLIGMEGHGREPILENVDISRTVGWFTSVYPVIITYAHEISRQVQEVKETLRNVPNKGIGYGILKYLSNEKMQFQLRPDISFNYLGQFDTDLSAASLEIAPESSGTGQHEMTINDHLVNVSGMITGAQLVMSVAIDTRHLSHDIAARLANSYSAHLRAIISHCASRPTRTLTPSDLTYKKLSLDELAAIVTDTTEDIYPLSPSQEGMLFHYLYNSSSQAYFNQISYRLQGVLNISAVRQSLQVLSQRHDILRTAFIYKDVERPLQMVLRDRGIEFEFRDLSALESNEKEQAVLDCKDSDRQRLFHADSDSLMRVTVVQLSPDEFEFIWSHHHIIMDGWCMGILMREYYEIYTSCINNIDYSLPVVRPYKEFIKWLMQQDQAAADNFWSSYLDTYDQPAPIPRQAHSSEGINKKSFVIEKARMQLLSQLAVRLQVTLNTVVQAIWGIMLSKYNNTNDVVFGSVVSGRPATIKDVEQMVGLFINTIPVRVEFDDRCTFRQLLTSLQQKALAAAMFHHAPLVSIQSQHPLKQNLFDHIMVFENYPVEEWIAGQEKQLLNEEQVAELTQVQSREQTHYDFTVIVNPRDELHITLDYNAALFNDDFTGRIPGHFSQLVDQVLANNERVVSELSILSPWEEKQLLQTFNDTADEFPAGKTLVTLFEEQVQRTPGRLAVVFNKTNLSYRELNEQSNQLAWYLRKRFDIKPGCRIGVMLSRSETLIIAIWGILKSGAAYVPIDLDFPEERKQFVIDDAALSCVLTDDDLRGAWQPQICNEPTENPPHLLKDNDTAYVIYTSGSTGMPKGCVLEHAGVMNRIDWMKRQYDFTAEDCVLQKTPVIFDVSVWEIFMTTCFGGRLVVCTKEVAATPTLLIEAIAEHQVTMMHFVPSFYEAFLETIDSSSLQQLSSLKHIVCSGEALLPETVRKHHKKLQAALHNLYGPTEASVDVSHYTTNSNDDIIPIGKPISNIRLYIFNQQKQLAPPGVEGEIGICGIGLARGYLNREGLTAQKFITCPFEKGERMYCTGDRGRWLPDGNIEYLGRIDEQVKLRGYRIEPGEVENLINSIEGISGSVVQARGEGADKYLVGWYRSSSPIDENIILGGLRKKLPAWMIPSYLVPVTEFPLTASGKVNRKLLPGPYLNTSTIAEARNETEQLLIDIWQQVLAREPIGIHDDFFALGGHSIKAIQLANLITKKLNRQVELRSIFQFPTIAQLAALLQQRPTAGYEQIPLITGQPYYALSHAQKRLWITHQLDLGQNSYNIANGFEINGPINRQALEQAFNSLMNKYEILRTSIIVVEGEPWQKILSDGEYIFKPVYDDMRHTTDKWDKARQLASEESETVFQLDKAPLFRCRLLQLEDEKHIFLLTIHHIIADGWSMEIFFNQLMLLYGRDKQNELQPLRIQYKDYANWETRQLTGEKFESNRKFWTEQLRNGAPVSELPVDFYRKPVQTFMGNKTRFLVDEEVTARINERLEQHGLTPFMFFVSIANVIMYKYTGSCDIVTGMAVNGRHHADLHDQIGLFVNLLPVRLQFEPGISFDTLAKTTKNVLLNCYAHDAYPFDLIVNDLGIKKERNRFPLFDVLVQMQESQAVALQPDAVPAETLQTGNFDYTLSGAKFDFTFSFHHVADIIEVTLEYNTDLYQASTIARMKTEIAELIKWLSDDWELTVHELKKRLSLNRELNPGNYAFINEKLEEDF